MAGGLTVAGAALLAAHAQGPVIDQAKAQGIVGEQFDGYLGIVDASKASADVKRRVSEVNARFTLDAMPGKQMSIDADLNAGVIDQETAKKRREELSQESDFFGSMDGASKFVSGDAVAGLLILIINIVGGLAIGVGQHNLPLADVTRIYVLLTIGDGLVAQIPSLFLSLATAIIVTRVTTSESMGEQASSQLANPPALFITASILTLLGLVPGMPHLVFLTLAAATAGIGVMVINRACQRRLCESAGRRSTATGVQGPQGLAAGAGAGASSGMTAAPCTGKAALPTGWLACWVRRICS